MAIKGLTHALNQQTTILSTLLGEGGSTLPTVKRLQGIRDRVTALDTPITWEAFRTPFLERYSPILQGREESVLPLEGSSGGSVMDERVAQQLGRQVAGLSEEENKKAEVQVSTSGEMVALRIRGTSGQT
ncbi:AcrB/AcrD/AcrF family protein [Sesbania bispinosa]|nr:AcrB/AcrD/AcrF family protein [Sesbania bispinosa]